MKKDDQPRGTLIVLLIYLGLIIISWVGVYLLMLQRGGV
jgi:hypothetical protein